MKFTRGQCENCGFKGLVARKIVARPRDLNSVTGEIANNLPILDLCMTCFETPNGCESENVTHKRLPEAEYQR